MSSHDDAIRAARTAMLKGFLRLTRQTVSAHQVALDTVAAYEAHMRPEITTVDGLDALPLGTVVLGAEGTVWTKGGDEELNWWERPTDEMGYGHSDVEVPARVLHWGDQ